MSPQSLADTIEAVQHSYKETCAAYLEAGIKANPLARDGAKVGLAVCNMLLAMYNYDVIRSAR